MNVNVLKKLAKNTTSLNSIKKIGTGIALGVSLVCAAAPAQANPSDPTIQFGDFTFDNINDAILHIYQHSQGGFIDWESFGIPVGSVVQFFHNNSDSITVNRITGDDPTRIYGSLLANGNVFIINQNGILFGAGSRVDVGGLVATTANLTPEKFQAGLPTGQFDFDEQGTSPGYVINEGNITVRNGGLLALAGGYVANHGVLSANLGKVHLHSGTDFTIDLYGDGLINFSLQDFSDNEEFQKMLTKLGATAMLENTGAIYANGGQAAFTVGAVQNLLDTAINMDGYVEAHSFGMDNDTGEIYLYAANGTGAIEVNGTLNASGLGPFGDGGEITIIGDSVTMNGHLDVSGDGLFGWGLFGSAGNIFIAGYDSLEIGGSMNFNSGFFGDMGSLTLVSDHISVGNQAGYTFNISSDQFADWIGVANLNIIASGGDIDFNDEVTTGTSGGALNLIAVNDINFFNDLNFMVENGDIALIALNDIRTHDGSTLYMDNGELTLVAYNDIDLRADGVNTVSFFSHGDTTLDVNNYGGTVTIGTTNYFAHILGYDISINVSGGYAGGDINLTSADTLHIADGMSLSGENTYVSATNLNIGDNAVLEARAGDLTMAGSSSFVAGDNVTFTGQDVTLSSFFGGVTFGEGTEIDADGDLLIFGRSHVTLGDNSTVSAWNEATLASYGNINIGNNTAISAGWGNLNIFAANDLNIGENASLFSWGTLNAYAGHNMNIASSTILASWGNLVITAMNDFIMGDDTTLFTYGTTDIEVGQDFITGTNSNILSWGSITIEAGRNLILGTSNIVASLSDLYMHAVNDMNIGNNTLVQGVDSVHAVANNMYIGDNVIMRANAGDLTVAGSASFVAGDNVTFTGQDITLSSFFGGVTFGSGTTIDADGDLIVFGRTHLTMGDNTDITSAGDSTLASYGDVLLGSNFSLTSSGLANLFAGNNLTMANGGSIIAANNLNIIAGNDLSIGSGSLLDGSGVTVDAGNNLTFANNVTIEATGDMLLTAGNDLSMGEGSFARATGNLTATAGRNIFLADSVELRALQQMTLDAGRNIEAGNNVSLLSRGRMVLAAARNIVFGKSATITSRTNSVDIEAGRNVRFGSDATVSAAQSIDIDAGRNVRFGNRATVTAGQHLTIDAGNDIRFGNRANIDATAGISMVAADDIRFGNNASVRTKGQMFMNASAGNLTIGDNAVLFSQNGAIDLRSGNQFSIGNNANITAGTNVAFTSGANMTIGENSTVLANDNLILNAGNNLRIMNGSSLTGANSVLVEANNDVSLESNVSLISGGNLTLTALNGLTIDTNALIEAGGTGSQLSISAAGIKSRGLIRNLGSGSVDITTTSGSMHFGNNAIELGTGDLTMISAGNIMSALGGNVITTAGNVFMSVVNGGTIGAPGAASFGIIQNGVNNVLELVGLADGTIDVTGNQFANLILDIGSAGTGLIDITNVGDQLTYSVADGSSEVLEWSALNGTAISLTDSRDITIANGNVQLGDNADMLLETTGDILLGTGVGSTIDASDSNANITLTSTEGQIIGLANNLIEFSSGTLTLNGFNGVGASGAPIFIAKDNLFVGGISPFFSQDFLEGVVIASNAGGGGIFINLLPDNELPTITTTFLNQLDQKEEEDEINFEEELTVGDATRKNKVGNPLRYSGQKAGLSEFDAGLAEVDADRLTAALIDGPQGL